SNLRTKVAAEDIEFLILIDLGFIPVDVVREKDVRQAYLLAAFQYFSPDLPLLIVSIDHFLHPIIRYTYPEKEVLDGISNVLDFQKFTDIRMVYIQIGGKSTTPHAALGNSVHCGIEETHKAGRAAALPVVGDCTAPAAQFPKIGRGSPAYFRLHNHLSQFVGDAFNIIGHIYVEAGDRQASFRSHIRPDR